MELYFVSQSKAERGNQDSVVVIFIASKQKLSGQKKPKTIRRNTKYYDSRVQLRVWDVTSAFDIIHRKVTHRKSMELWPQTEEKSN